MCAVTPDAAAVTWESGTAWFDRSEDLYLNSASDTVTQLQTW